MERAVHPVTSLFSYQQVSRSRVAYDPMEIPNAGVRTIWAKHLLHPIQRTSLNKSVQVLEEIMPVEF